ncbi:HAMP domain-containing histidine kinase [Comamonas thiooxydans]|uniref:sensor histidine kinase n=1 Tax=Comamonas thiooxydans TaxID=363952 RepID=UPI000B35AC86|nr:HAMP domain-containing sensor histidine kinase [Comamonas thiooxydans]BDR07221.1 HAMP domain-containing histidine kinase [Comamonas thiooxydans]
MEPMQQVVESKVPRTLDEALALLVRREAELAALRAAQQEWVHAVSHDLRAPLRHLLAFNPLIAELLQSPSPGVEDLEEARSFLQTMDQSAQRMAAMFEGLLQLARAQRHVLQPQPVDLLALLGSLRQRLQAGAQGRRIEWCLPVAAPKLQADPHLLEQALDAALANAVKFTRTVPLARIQVDVQRDGQGGCFITVADNGAGFEQARSGKLFGVFQRMHREAEFEGLGIGLALVRDVCRRHGGEAEIQAQLNAGCQLQMHWPTCLP